jgi:molybdopterin molybdotransferase
MKDFFNVTPLETVLEWVSRTHRAGTEAIELFQSQGRVLAQDLVADDDLPPFARSTMDGYAVKARSTFGASEGTPAYLSVKGAVAMAERPYFRVEDGEAARIPTGGMVPENADSVVMIEHADTLGETAIEVYRSVAPGQNVIEKGEDFKKGATVLEAGTLLRPQEAGVLAAFGKDPILVYKRPVIGIISTGDEVVPVTAVPRTGSIRDMNTHTLSGLVRQNGGTPRSYGIVKDQKAPLFQTLERAVMETDMVLVSGGSSVGVRDFTLDAISSLADSKILVHGIAISPGKPTILASATGKFVWGIPGHVTSAMIVFCMVVKPFLDHLRGIALSSREAPEIRAILTRNVPSSQGRRDFIRVRLIKKGAALYAEPILGKSGLIHTMVRADGVIAVGMNDEGVLEGTEVQVIPI